MTASLQSAFGFTSAPGLKGGGPQPAAALPDDELLRTDRYQVQNFHSAALPNDDRAVSIYLPAAYHAEPTRRFPVLYLHDGQNLFDGRTSYVPGCTWRAHATADYLTDTGEIRPLILVGIANTGLRRMSEYTPTRDFRMGGGDGPLYSRLLTEELKPEIDGRFRTLPGPRDTGLGGSSLGGLISLFVGLKFPDIFGRLAVMSPSLWWDHRSILNFASRVDARPDLRIWLDMGTSEGVRHLRDADLLARTLSRRGWVPGRGLAYTRVEGGLHNEEAWARRFGDVLRFLFPAQESTAESSSP